MWTIVNNELYHYGVKGMKWGVRRADKLARGAAKLVRSEVEADQSGRSYYTRQFKDKREMNKAAADFVDKSHRVARNKMYVDGLVKRLDRKYSSVKASLEKDAKTGRTYVQAILKDKRGQTYTAQADVGIDYIRPEKN